MNEVRRWSSVRLVVGMIVLLAAFPLLAGPARGAGENAKATGAVVDDSTWHPGGMGGFVGRLAPADCPPGGPPATSPGMTVGNLRDVTIGASTATCDDMSAAASAANVEIANGLQFAAIESQCTTGPDGSASSSVLVVRGGGVVPDNTVVTTPLTFELIPGGGGGIPLLTIRLNETRQFPSGGRIVAALNIFGRSGGLSIQVAESACTAQPTTNPPTTTTIVPPTTTTTTFVPPTTTIVPPTTTIVPPTTTTTMASGGAEVCNLLRWLSRLPGRLGDFFRALYLRAGCPT